MKSGPYSSTNKQISHGCFDSIKNRGNRREKAFTNMRGIIVSTMQTAQVPAKPVTKRGRLPAFSINAVHTNVIKIANTFMISVAYTAHVFGSRPKLINTSVE